MSVVEPLGSYDSETQIDPSRPKIVRLVDLLGPISPELVLVDPQLAAHARVLLPDRDLAWLPDRVEPAAPAPMPARRPALPTRPTRWRLIGACAALVVSLAGAGLWMTLQEGAGDPSTQGPAADAPTFFSTPPIDPDLSPGAVAALEEAVRREPRSSLAREALGTAYFRLRRWKEAEAEYRVLIELLPTDEFAHYALGQALAEQGRQAEAARQFELAESLSGG